MSTTAELHAAALRYAQRGIPVFPVVGKKPHPRYAPNGFNSATRDADQINNWFSNGASPTGIACEPGAIGALVIDVDERNNGLDSLARLEQKFGTLPPTSTALTPGPGEHRWFALPAGITVRSRNAAFGDEYPGVDVKSAAGYVVLPPSTHPNGGSYCWDAADNDRASLKEPQWLAALVDGQRNATRTAIPGVDDDERIPSGKRRDVLLRYAGRLRRNGTGAAAIEDALLALNRRQSDPPLPDDEVRALARDVGGRYKAEPLTTADVDRIVEFAHHGDLGATELFVEMHGHGLRFVRQVRQFYVPERTRWVPDGGDRVLSYAQSVSKALYGLANSEQDQERRETLAKFGLRFESRRLLENVVALAKGMPNISVDASDFDADPFMLNTAGGVLDLYNGELRPAREGELFTKLTGTRYERDATCPRWVQFLDEIFCGNAELIEFVHRLAGLSLCGSQAEQLVPVCYGLGANGKSVFLGALSYALGDYATATNADTFMRDRKTATNDLARLAGARFVTAVEVEDGKTFSEALIKSISGDDRITARFLFKEFFEFVPQFKVWFAVNHRPVVRGNDHGIWRRLRLIPFEARFAGRTRDNNLAQRLREEAPGILAWAVRGCLAWQADGLRTPDAVRIATETYRSDMDTLRPFLDDCCNVATDESVTSADLYRAYRSWAENNGERPATSQTFGRRLTDRGFRNERTKSARRWRGLTLALQEGQG